MSAISLSSKTHFYGAWHRAYKSSRFDVEKQGRKKSSAFNEDLHFMEQFSLYIFCNIAWKAPLQLANTPTSLDEQIARPAEKKLVNKIYIVQREFASCHQQLICKLERRRLPLCAAQYSGTTLKIRHVHINFCRNDLSEAIHLWN